MKILSTTNYSLFHNNPFQRKFTRAKVDSLKAKMKANGFTPSLAISVYRSKSGELTINTGHHRLAAAKELGIPVLYVIEHQWEISEMVDEGVTGTPWNIASAVIAFAKKGLRDYQELLGYADKGIPLGMAASMLLGEGAASGNGRDKINAGAFKIKTREQIKVVVSVIEQFSEASPAVRSRSFIAAFSKCLLTPEFDVDTFIRRIKNNPPMLEKTSNEDQMLKQIEDIYNYRSPNKIPLAFFVTKNMKDRHQSFGRGKP